MAEDGALRGFAPAGAAWTRAAERPSPGVAAIRAQRSEVDALLAFRIADPASPAAAQAWWRLQSARRARLDLLTAAEASALSPVPPPPVGAVTPWQRLRHRMGLLRWEEATMPGRFAREVTGEAGGAPATTGRR